MKHRPYRLMLLFNWSYQRFPTSDRLPALNRNFSTGSIWAIDTQTTIIGSDLNFRRYFAKRPLDRINLRLIKLKPNADANQIATAIRQIVPADVVVLTKQQAIDRDRKFWINTTSTGFIFTMGVAVSCIVGTAIVYQILALLI